MPASTLKFDGLASPAAGDVAPPGPGDEALVRLIRDGDKPAGSLLVDRHAPALLGYLRRLCGSDHLAEELHQSAWLSALEHLDKFDATGNAGGFKAWLFRIATNKANDHWRRGGRERRAKAGLKLVSAAFAEVADRADADEQSQRLRDAVEKLPDAQREVLLLRYYGGLKFVEIADMLGCPLNTALGRMHKAMNKLKAMLDPDGLSGRETPQ